MRGETEPDKLLKTINPVLHSGEYVFCSTNDPSKTDLRDTVLLFREQEGYTLILEKEKADQLELEYSFVASWITLNVHSSLEAVGFTAAFSAALAREKISCNVVAGFFHDHIFVPKKDSEKALKVLSDLSEL